MTLRASMVKTYLRYAAAGAFGVVASPGANVLFDASGKLLVCAALDKAALWNAKQGALVRELPAAEAAAGPAGIVEVTVLARPDAGAAASQVLASAWAGSRWQGSCLKSQQRG